MCVNVCGLLHVCVHLWVCRFVGVRACVHAYVCCGCAYLRVCVCVFVRASLCCGCAYLRVCAVGKRTCRCACVHAYVCCGKTYLYVCARACVCVLWVNVLVGVPACVLAYVCCG